MRLRSLFFFSPTPSASCANAQQYYVEIRTIMDFGIIPGPRALFHPEQIDI